MDKSTKNYIDEIVKPLLSRIDYLQETNQQLKIQVKYLESLVANDKSYAKPTISAANHMRNSKVSSKGDVSPDKRPNWNSKTKIDYVPVINLQPLDILQMKVKPPLPRLMKSTSKREHEEQTRNSDSRKKDFRNNTFSGTIQAEKFNSNASKRPFNPSRNSRQVVDNDDQQAFEQNIGQINERSGQIGILNHKFQQLVKTNTEILTCMKQNNQTARQILKNTENQNNYVQKVRNPRSQNNNESHTASPNDRSFISESQAQKQQTKYQIK